MIYENFLEQFTNWRPETSYWQRFSIAEKYGKREIQEVYDEFFMKAKDNYKMLTELVMMLNHKSFQHCENYEDSTLCEYYVELFEKTRDYAYDHLEGEGLRYFLDVTD